MHMYTLLSLFDFLFYLSENKKKYCFYKLAKLTKIKMTNLFELEKA